MGMNLLTVAVFASAALTGYLISGINPAIILSRAIYGKDIRECGSKNPGFTNFKRTFGMKWAWVVLVCDLFKSALPSVIFGIIFESCFGAWSIGVTFTCLCSMIGHAYPVWYHFRGGKGFLVCLSAMWALDWRIGLISTALMLILLILTRYMSLSTTVAMLICPVLHLVFGGNAVSVCLCSVCVLIMAVRHKENYKRLVQGNESKFVLKKG